MKYLEAVNNVLNRILMVLGGIAVLSLMLLATGNVVLRIFNLPLRGTYEIVSFLGAVVIAFALGYTQTKRDHIVVDIVSDKFPKWLQKAMDTLADCLIMAFFAVVSWQVILWGLKLRETREVSETLKVIFHPFVFAVGAGFALLSLTALVDILRKLSGQED